MDFITYSHKSVTQKDKKLLEESMEPAPCLLSESPFLFCLHAEAESAFGLLSLGSNSAMVMPVYMLYLAYWRAP